MAAESELGAGAVGRLRFFLNKAVRSGLVVVPDAKQWIAFRTYALRHEPQWNEPRRYQVPLFYFYNVPKEYSIEFSTSGPYRLSSVLTCHA